MLNLAADGTILAPVLTPPSVDTHKYARGAAVVFSGPALHTGASRLSATAALAVGAGLVTIIGDRRRWWNMRPCTAIMLRAADAELSVIDSRTTALAIGPGAGADIADTVCALLDRGIPTVLDADAITAFDGDSARLFKISAHMTS